MNADGCIYDLKRYLFSFFGDFVNQSEQIKRENCFTTLGQLIGSSQTTRFLVFSKPDA